MVVARVTIHAQGGGGGTPTASDGEGVADPKIFAMVPKVPENSLMVPKVLFFFRLRIYMRIYAGEKKMKNLTVLVFKN